ncbi:DUF6042 family protein [Streptomyces sp. NPDC048481]|uniref:DUF6042 family protein n=1 Tax=Streptomyces sp. NPDC048481 TaxID=3365557 RepID=UPI003711ED80
MTENLSVPGPRRDLTMHNDWWASGWDHVLPRQGFPLPMLIGTASQTLRTGPLVDGLINHLADDLSEPQETLTSLDRLAAATSRHAGDVRVALAELVRSGDAREQRGQEPADAERQEAHQRFRLLMKRDHLHGNRLQLSIMDDGA